jgi:hypothetical protein
LNSSNIDTSGNNNGNNPIGHSGTKNNGNKEDDKNSNYNNQSTPERWILVLAMTILALGIILLTLRSVIFSLILIIIGVSLFAYWLYVGVRSKEEHRLFSDYNTSSSSTNSGGKEGEHICTYPICKHHESNACMELRCPCCILTRNRQIIGHFNNPLQ